MNEFIEIIKEREIGKYIENASMKRFTSYKVGGVARCVVYPKNTKKLIELLRLCNNRKVKYKVLGNGTNTLFSDKEFDGIIIKLDEFNDLTMVNETTLKVGAGYNLIKLALFATKKALSGLEFACGIPVTVGGAVYMNAGAYGGEIKDVVESVEVMDFSGQIRQYSPEEMGFAYRHSVLEERDAIVISATFRLREENPETIKETMRQLQAKRSASQPLDMPSAGSAFKRPVGGFAAALIQDAGLKGYQVGGAAISTKHSGFAVNMGGATAEDVKNLLAQVSDIVFEKTGIRLEPEVRIW